SSSHLALTLPSTPFPYTTLFRSKPDVDSIEGLSPAISIEQKTGSRNPRSTVGTATEIYDYLRLLWARVGIVHCYNCGKPIASQRSEEHTSELQSLRHLVCRLLLE